MTDKVVTLRIVGENGQLLGAIKSSRSELDSLGRSAASSGQQGSAGLDKIGESAQRNKRDLDAMSGSVKGLGSMIAGLGIAAFAKRVTTEFIAAADRAGQLEARIRNATSTQAEFNYVLERSGQIGRASYQSINTIGEIAINAAGPMKQLGFSIRDTLDLTEAMSLSLVASAANQQRSTATVDQFSKALQLGVLRGEAFNTVLSNAPEFVSALERALGKTRAEIIAMANAGQLTVGELTKVASELDTLNQKVEAMPTTVEDAWTRFGDVFQENASKINQSTGATGALVTVIEALSASIGPLVTVAGLAAVAIGGNLVAGLVASAAATVKKIVASRQAAVAELAAARAAEQRAVALVAMSRAGMGAVGAEAALTAATARTAAAMRTGTVAALAKTAAMRGLNLVMGAFGGPVGLAITALSLFAIWLARGSSESRKLKKEVSELGQTADEAAERFENLNRAQQAGVIIELSRQVKAATKDMLVDARRLESEFANLGIQKPGRDAINAVRELREEWQAGRISGDQFANSLSEQAEKLRGSVVASDTMVDRLVRMAAGIGTSSRELDGQRSILDAVTGKHREMAGAASANADAHRDLKDAVNIDWSDIDKSLNQQLTQSRLRLIEQTQGKAAAMRSGFAIGLGTAGGDVTSPEALQRRAINEEIIENTLLYDANAESARKAGAAGKDYARDGEARKRELQQHADSQARWTDELDRTAAAFEGPLKAAEIERKQRLAALDAELKSNTISQTDHVRGQELAARQYKETTAEIEREQDVMARMKDDYRDAIALQGMSAEAQRVELELRQRINDAQRAGRELAPGEIADLRAEITVREQHLDLLERAAASAENYERMWDGAINSVGALIGDSITKASDQYRGFGRELKDITKRFLSDIVAQFASDTLLSPLKNWLRQLTSGGFAQAGGSAGGGFGGVLGALFGGGGGNGMGGWAGNVGGALRAWMGGSAGGPAVNGYVPAQAGMGGAFGWGNVAGSFAGVAGAGGYGGGAGGGGLVEIGGQLVQLGGMAKGSFLANQFGAFTPGVSGMSYGSVLGGIGGMYYGATQRGNGGMSSAAAGLSYGAAGLAAGGAMAGMAAGTGAMAGAGTAMGALGSAAWIPVVGWILAAAAVVDMISGGKLFGTKFALDSSASTIDFDAAGITGMQELHESRQKALFGGKKRRTRTQAFDDESQSALDDVFKQMNQGIAQAARQVGVDAPGMVAASFRQEFDKKGNLKKEFGTIAGRVYEEAQEVFFERLAAENLLNVAKQVGNGGEIDRLADRYRDTPESLDEFAQFMVAVQGDINNAKALWTASGPGMLTSIVETMDRLAIGAETLLQTYQRINDVALEYGNLIAGVETQLLTADLNDYQKAQLDIELGYRGQIKQANELAKALGLTGARSEDLAKIEALRAHNMAALQRQQEAQKNTFLEDLGLSDLSTLRDDQKRLEAMALTEAAVAAGDMQRAQQVGQQFLGFSRNLNASGRDYQADYDWFTDLMDGMTPAALEGFNDEQLDNIASLIEGLPQGIATAMFQLVAAPPPAPITPWTPPTPANPPGGGSSSATTDKLLQQMLDRLNKIEGNTGGQLQQSRSNALEARNNGVLVQQR